MGKVTCAAVTRRSSEPSLEQLCNIYIIRKLQENRNLLPSCEDFVQQSHLLIWGNTSQGPPLWIPERNFCEKGFKIQISWSRESGYWQIPLPVLLMHLNEPSLNHWVEHRASSAYPLVWFWGHNQTRKSELYKTLAVCDKNRQKKKNRYFLKMKSGHLNWDFLQGQAQFFRLYFSSHCS